MEPKFETEFELKKVFLKDGGFTFIEQNQLKFASAFDAHVRFNNLMQQRAQLAFQIVQALQLLENKLDMKQQNQILSMLDRMSKELSELDEKIKVYKVQIAEIKKAANVEYETRKQKIQKDVEQGVTQVHIFQDEQAEKEHIEKEIAGTK